MRVVIGEDSLLLREGIARVLEAAGIDVVGLAGDYDELIAAVTDAEPDVAVTDIRMPPTHTDEGLRAAKHIRAHLPATGVLVLSQYLDEDYVFALLGDGAESLGYMLKDRITDGDAFVDAVRRVAAGDAALDPEVVAHLLGRSSANGPLDDLTERERTVLSEMAEGRSNQAIAARMFLSDRAVERHVTAIFSKLELTATPENHRRVLAVLTYLRA
ncbi:response regulator transcription factor [Solirubrobacter ginsenosidimutans]|uniref:Response regulator transcription factor n=1 Tax=Solirubrobacter ginsenosidimutans TaxID=490573 RepID=A0A9X3N0F0_9ACTN|nr:response regulator transcription factor [Solirubrobacter ginsenosidimutans]MDA0164778.1 response regulator transcription factor [Solirubrobacter ginsenosidimutans]